MLSMPLGFSVTDYRKQRHRKSRLKKTRDKNQRIENQHITIYGQKRWKYLERDTHTPLLNTHYKRIGESTLYAGAKVSLGCTSVPVAPWQQKVFEKEMSFPPQAQFLGQNVPTKTDLTQKPQTSFYTWNWLQKLSYRRLPCQLSVCTI